MSSRLSDRAGAKAGRVRRHMLCAALAALAGAGWSWAGTVATDGTVGSKTTLGGPTFNIPASLGQQKSGNLFQSFAAFSLNKGETASFSGPGSVNNVIARVTGGAASNIDGTIQCTIPKANFYLINPSGVIFGPDAALDVSGSFVVTTADYLKFADGNHFNATNLGDTMLTSAAPAAFGFLAAKPAAIAVNGSTLSNPSGTISIIGGDVQIVGGKIVAPAQRVNLVSAASPGILTLDAASVLATIDLTPGGPTLGDVSMTSSGVGVAGPGSTGPGGGKVSVRAGSLEMVNSVIVATNAGAADGLGVDIAVTGTVMLAPGTITTSSNGAGQAGPISITASVITLNGTGFAPLATGISAAANATGPGGKIQLTTGSLSIVAGSTIFAGSTAAGDAGSISINATGDVYVDGTSTILTPSFVAGRAGDTSISAGSLELTNGGTISASTSSLKSAGNITIDAGSVAIDDIGGTGASAGIISKSAATGAGGNAGNISINTSSLSVTEGASISASTNGLGAAGSVTVTGGSVLLDQGTSTGFTGIFAASFNPTGGAAGSVSISGTNMQVLGGAVVNAGNSGTGSAGSINVNVNSLVLDNRGATAAAFGDTGFFAESGSTSTSAAGGQISVKADTITLLSSTEIAADATGGGNAGIVSIIANQSLTVDGQGSTAFTGLSAESFTGAGSAGTVQISGGSVLVRGGATLSVGALGSGAAGTVSVTANQSFTIDGQRLPVSTGIFASTTDGPGGNVRITGGELSVLGGGQIGVDSFGAGVAGTITINVHDMTVQGSPAASTLIGAGTFGTGNAGTVDITANALSLIGATGITAETAGSASAGTVKISASSLTLDGTGGVASINAVTNGAANAGIVTIQAGTMQVLNGSTVNADTLGSGNGGVVSVTANTLTVDRGSSANIDGILAQSIATNGTMAVTNPGSGGTVNIHAGALVLNNNAAIDTTTFGAGAAGGINISADSIVLENGGSITSNTQGLGPAGNITITTGSLQILNGSQITSDTLTSGAGGTVSVTVTGSLMIDAQGFKGPSATGITAASNGLGGNAGDVTVQAGSLDLLHHGTIGSDSEGGTGSAGKVTVSANSIEVQSDATISSGTFGSGTGGDVYVTGKRVILNGANEKAFTGITAQTNATGNAGAVHVSADSLELINGGEISSTTFAAGAGGSVYISAADLTLKNHSVVDSASIVSGVAGTVNIQLTDSLSLAKSQITSQSLKVSGGGISIFAGNSVELRGSKITTQAGGEGGTINIRCPGTIDLVNSKILTQAGDNGGNMVVDPTFVILETSRLSANGGNNGGNITVRPDWLLESQSMITATGKRGVGGTVQITPDYNLTGALVSLPASLSDSLTLQAECAADLPGAVSSFIVTGRGAPPIQPGGWVPELELRLPWDKR